MNEIPCLGLSFLSKCSEQHFTEHFLFNFETAISSLAIVIAIYALILERRFRARIAIKRDAQKKIIKLIVAVVVLTFTGAILPYIPGRPLPLLGYPSFWEIMATLPLFFGIFLSFSLFKPINTLTKNQISALAKYAPHSTVRHHGSLDLILREAEYFWSDFLKKSLVDKSLQSVLINDFSQRDFLKIAAKSRYILIDTIEFIGKSNAEDNIGHIKNFLRVLIFANLKQDESVLSDDLNSSYKDLMQHIIRKRKLANVIFGNSIDLFSLRLNKNENLLKILKHFVAIFHLYLGRRYHYTEDTSNYIKLIKSEVLKNLLSFFKDSLLYLNYQEQSDLLNQLSFTYIDLKNLPEQQSKILAEGIYKILENYASGRDWSKNSWEERHLCLILSRHYVECNQYTKQVFEQKLLEQIVGSEDQKKITHSVYNLKGYYPMMIPIYFFIYGFDLFANKELKTPKNDIEMHMIILRKMQENLPKIASGRTQEYIERVEIPKDERGINIIKKKADTCLRNMFPSNIIYNKEENSITYVFGNEEHSETILLNETVKKNEIIFKK